MENEELRMKSEELRKNEGIRRREAKCEIPNDKVQSSKSL